MYVVRIFLTVRRFYQYPVMLVFYDVRWPTSQFHYIKIQPIKTVDLSTWLQGINLTNPLIISRSLLLRVNFNISKLIYSLYEKRL